MSRPNLTLVAPAAVPGDVAPGDDALMALAGADDARAFGVLVARHEAGLRRLAGLLGVDAERARELVQDAFIVAWDKRATYRPEGRLESGGAPRPPGLASPSSPRSGGSVRAWLASIVRNLATRERRKARVRAFFGMSTPPAWTAPSTLDDGFTTIAAADRDRVLAAALQRLPPKMREALVMRFVEGLDYEQMARALGTSASTLRSRVHYGLAQLAPLVPEELLR